MTKYVSFFRIRFITGLQYRAAAISGMVTQFAWGAMLLLIYDAFYKSNPTSIPMEFSQLSSYLWLNQAFFTLFATFLFENDIFDSITSGGVAYDLCRPMDIYSMWFSKSVANRLSKSLLRFLPVILFSIFLAKPYNLSMPLNFSSFILFIISLFLAMVLVVSFCMLIYIGAFFTQSVTGLRLIAIGFTEILSGAIVPFPFLPTTVRFVFELLPFAYMQNIPFRIYSGNISGKDIYISILLQIFWTIILILIGKKLINKALKKVVIQGG